MKKISIILLSLIMTAGCLFASDYAPLEKSSYFTVTDSEGNVLFDGEATDETSADFIAAVYNGNLVTPETEGVTSSVPVLIGTEEVDGIICDVYSVNISLDEALLTGGVSAGNILGWDDVENTFDGTLSITYAVNPETGEKLKQTASFTGLTALSDLAFGQTAEYEVFTVGDEAVSLPSSVLTAGTFTDENGNTVTFSIDEAVTAYTSV